MALTVGLRFAGASIIETDFFDENKSFNILCYVGGISWLFYVITEIPIWIIFQDSKISMYATTIILLPIMIWSWTVLEKFSRIGFWRQQLAFTLTIIMALLIMLPFLLIFSIFIDRIVYGGIPV